MGSHYRSALAALAIAASQVLCVFGSANAQTADWPKQPIKLLIGFAAGGGNDLFGRLVAQRLSDKLGQPVVVENKPGAGSIIAFETTARAAPDGYTLAVAPFGASVVNPAVYAKLPYDPINGLQPISIVASFPFVLTVSSTLPVTSVQELAAYAKAHPDKANYGSQSATFQLLVEQLKAQTGMPFEQIPVKSTAEAITGILNGQYMMAFCDPGPLVGHLKSGRVKALAHSGSTRFPELPDIPTMAEVGYPGIVMDSFMGIIGPHGLPTPIVKRLETELIAMTKDPEQIKHLAAMALVPVGTTAVEFQARLASEIPKWTAVAKAANVKFE